MVKTEVIENSEFDSTVTDLMKRDQIIDRITAYLSNEPLNIGRNEYCYIKVINNHLEIGRAKIVLEE